MARIAAFVLVIVVLLIGGWFLYRTLYPTPKYTGPVEKIKIGNIGEYSIFNIIAKEKGYFKDYGLDAEITEYEAGPPAVAALLAGDVDIALAAEFVGVRNLFTNPELRILSQASTHYAFHVVARRDKGITSPADLLHKKIGVTKKGAGEFYLGRFLTANNIKLTDVTIVDLTPPQMSAQLQNGTLDAVVIFDPHAYNLQKSLGTNAISWDAQAGEKIHDLFYSTDIFIQSHPDVMRRYLAALYEAEKYTKKHTVDAQSIIASALHYEKPYIAHMWDNFTFELSLDQELLLTMEDQANWLITNKLTDQTAIPNYLEFIYFRPLQEVKPQSVTIIH